LFPNGPQLVACPLCGKKGYTDERRYDSKTDGYLCARCALPVSISWTIYTNA